MSQKRLTAIVLAAGHGKRMGTPLPKVLHPVAGRPMLSRVIDVVKVLGATEIRAVVGYGENLVRQVLEPQGVTCFKQQQQLGTADAVKSAKIDDLEGEILILNGDHPLLRAEDLKKVLEEFRAENMDLAVVTAIMKEPGSLGRIVRYHGELKAIVEKADASQETLKIKEVNSGIYLVKASRLQEYLPQIKNGNSQKEFYLTDMVSIALESRHKVKAIPTSSRIAFGVNTQRELAKATRLVFRNKCLELMEKGVILVDPRQTYIEEQVEVGAGAVIYPGVHLKGKTLIGSFALIEPNCLILDCEVAESVQIKMGCHFEKTKIAKGAILGPYARLRPDTFIGEEAHVGNFVEMKKVSFGARAKANHLTYLGDAEVGDGSNIGCGTITCNYAVDRKKYKTVIGKNVFVGSDTQFIAPIEIGDGAVIASGSTITKPVPANALAVSRGKQFIKENYNKGNGTSSEKKD